MTPTFILLNIIGGIVLLLYGLRQIKRSIMRGYGAHLRGFLTACTVNRFTGWLAGVGTTALMQSALALTIILSTFVSQKMVTTAAAIPVMIGADLGVSLIAQVLTFNLAMLAPLFLFIGFMFITSFQHRKKVQNLGLIIFGFGLLLFSLGVIREASIPFRDSPVIPYLIKPLEVDPVFTVLVGALLTWLLHSSLAFLMLIVTFAASGVITPDVALELVLGSTLGGSIGAMVSVARDPFGAVRLPFANFLMRSVLIVAVLPFMDDIERILSLYEKDVARQAVHFHLGFNLLVSVVFLPLTPVVAWVVHRLIPEKDHMSEDLKPKYLIDTHMSTPVVALSAAARETLRIADMVTDMLSKSLVVFKTHNEQMMRDIQAQDTAVDTLHRAIKIYMARALELSLSPKEAQRHLQIINFATSLEHIGDTIDKSLMPMAQRMIQNHRKFSAQGMAEIEQLFSVVVDRMRLAQTVFMSLDEGLARRLVEGKEEVNRLERQASSNHYSRLNQGIPESLETSSIHLDILRDLQRINGDVVTVAYPILEETGELLPSRLRVRPLRSLEPDLRDEG
jgi:phosphate:Na+ symporter